MNKCLHKNLTDDIEVSIVDYCPKGCDGEGMIDGDVYCVDCGKIIYSIHRGHEDCKYGRN